MPDPRSPLRTAVADLPPIAPFDRDGRLGAYRMERFALLGLIGLLLLALTLTLCGFFYTSQKHNSVHPIWKILD